MSLRRLLTKINDAIRPAHAAGAREGEKKLTSDKDDALTIGAGQAPTNWVPSQQDERPR
jgi:hypothetical protein